MLFIRTESIISNSKNLFYIFIIPLIYLQHKISALVFLKIFQSSYSYYFF